MTLRNSLTAALGALAVSITLSAVVLPAMAIEPPRVSCGEEGDCVAIDPHRAASSYRSRFSPPPSGPGLVTRS